MIPRPAPQPDGKGGRRVVDGAWTDDATDAARAGAARGRRPDHDAGLRQARTALNAPRDRVPWGTPVWAGDWTRPATLVRTDPDGDADVELTAMTRPDRDRIEALARATQRTYRGVLRRRRELRAADRSWGAYRDAFGLTDGQRPGGWQ